MRTAAQTAMLMSILTLIGKCFGFLREMVIANYFGATYITDAYVIALTVPSIIFSGVLGSIALAYMPIYSKVLENQGKRESNEFTSRLINILFFISLVGAIVGIIFSDQIVTIFANGFHGETAELCSFFLKVTFSYMIFTSTAGILETFLQYKGVFLPQITLGYIMNTMVIIGAIVSGMFSHYYLVFGWLLGYIIRFIAVAFMAKRKNFSYAPSIKIEDNIKGIIALAVPVFIGSSISQVGVFVDKTLASGLTEGSVAALNYGMLLITLITGLTISILSTILYPRLVKAHSIGDSNQFSIITDKSMILIFILAVPCSLGAMVYNEQIVHIVYERGAFDAIATGLTASAFFYYAIGLLFLSMNDFLIRTYYAMHDVKTPLLFGAIAVAVDIIFNLILVKSMAHNGLALSTSIGALCYTFLMLMGLRLKYPNIHILKEKKVFLKIFVAAILAVGISYLVYISLMIRLSHITAALEITLILAVLVACVIYFLLLYIMKIDELRLIKQIFAR